MHCSCSPELGLARNGARGYESLGRADLGSAIAQELGPLPARAAILLAATALIWLVAGVDLFVPVLGALVGVGLGGVWWPPPSKDETVRLDQPRAPQPFTALGRTVAPLVLPLLVVVGAGTIDSPWWVELVVGTLCGLVAWGLALRRELAGLRSILPVIREGGWAVSLAVALIGIPAVLVAVISVDRGIERFDDRGGWSSALLLFAAYVWAVAALLRLVGFATSWLRMAEAIAIGALLARLVVATEGPTRGASILRTYRRRTGLWAALVVAAALAGLPAPAQAKVDSDPCRGTVIGPGPSGLICGKLDQLQGGEEALFGGPLYTDYPNVNALPASEQLQCPPGTRMPGTDYWSRAFAYNWGWDYYVEYGNWVVWDGTIWGLFPRDGTLAGGAPGYNSIDIELNNWHYGSSDWLDVRAFWKCEPLGSKAWARPDVSRGGSGADVLSGDGRDNALIAHAGDDRILGRGGDDHLQGGPGDDAFFGGAHDDLIHGRRGSDEAVGGNGSDDILTGKGRDVARGGKDGDQLFDDEGRDELRGGRGNDRFSARDGDRDVIRCGAGEDIAIVDELDVTTGCEFAYRSDRATPDRLPNV